jgi:cephalosporin-C deacetylase-like acetyl esterase
MNRFYWPVNLPLHFVFAVVAATTFCDYSVLLAVEQGAAKTKSVAIRLAPRTKNGLFREGQAIRLSAKITSLDASARQGVVRWRLETATHKLLATRSHPIELAANASQELDVQFKAPNPGFFHVVCGFESTEKMPSSSESMRVGYAPELLQMPLTAATDFWTFWQAAKDELADVAPQFNVIPQAMTTTDKVNLYLVEMRSVDNVLVRGWLSVPKSAGPYPAVLRLPGYGSTMRPVTRFEDLIVFSFNIRGHGNSCNDVSGEPKDFWIRGLEDKSRYFYRGAYMDCLRAVQFLCERDEVDPKRIAVWGGSQGGGLSLATAALDERVALCVTDIPFLVNWVDYFELTDWPEMNKWIAADPQRTWSTTQDTLAYFDVMNMAPRIKSSVWMNIGLQDKVCPPTTELAAFNHIAGPKELRVFPNAGHGLPRDQWDGTWKRLRDHLIHRVSQ